MESKKTKRFENIAKLIKTKRVALGISQNSLAKKVGCEKSGQFISNVERGQCSIPLSRLNEYSKSISASKKDLKEAIISDFINHVNSF